ncbi:hypothetical protein PAAG_08748 [Paracoccidioides lutzii Pb01]|uniref:Uncharacterized protein n=1 Tax=Paracoccidioides lutzii (strain ATCC MYA-826 / Pb01) TaxID=502779 RepID=C1HDA7_PARBA|nr:hypothetical protein PAAG_08748 [Paracoccidioides lutzii Pb01]EEH39479.2 hypothetical protein PAAG_08748 [Paracoccidioides lutzii Pb01]
MALLASSPKKVVRARAISQPTTLPANSQPASAPATPSTPASPPPARRPLSLVPRQPKNKRSGKREHRKRLHEAVQTSPDELKNSMMKTAETYFKDKTTLVDISVHLINSQPLDETIHEGLWKRSVDIFANTDSKASRARRLEEGRAVLQTECSTNDYAKRLSMLLSRIEIDEMTLSVPDNECRQGVGKATIANEQYAKEANVDSEYVSTTKSRSRNYARLVIKSGPGILACLDGQDSRTWERRSLDVDLLLKFVKEKYPKREETFRRHDRICAKAMLSGLRACGWTDNQILQSKGKMLTAMRKYFIELVQGETSKEYDEPSSKRPCRGLQAHMPRVNSLGDLGPHINSHGNIPMQVLAAAATSETQRDRPHIAQQVVDTIRSLPSANSQSAPTELNHTTNSRATVEDLAIPAETLLSTVSPQPRLNGLTETNGMNIEQPRPSRNYPQSTSQGKSTANKPYQNVYIQSGNTGTRSILPRSIVFQPANSAPVARPNVTGSEQGCQRQLGERRNPLTPTFPPSPSPMSDGSGSNNARQEFVPQAAPHNLDFNCFDSAMEAFACRVVPYGSDFNDLGNVNDEMQLFASQDAVALASGFENFGSANYEMQQFASQGANLYVSDSTA